MVDFGKWIRKVQAKMSCWANVSVETSYSSWNIKIKLHLDQYFFYHFDHFKLVTWVHSWDTKTEVKPKIHI